MALVYLLYFLKTGKLNISKQIQNNKIMSKKYFNSLSDYANASTSVFDQSNYFLKLYDFL